MAIEWTAAKISSLSTDELKSLRDNCLKKGVHDVAAACDAELANRGAAKRSTNANKGKFRKDKPVLGYHFVCRPEGKGVVRNSDGTVWSGTWVVAADQAKNSLSIGGYVALHLSHAEPSYLQGNIKAWRRSKREDAYAEGQKVKTPVGTDFLLEITNQPLTWRGDGTMERSYVYASDVQEEQ